MNRLQKQIWIIMEQGFSARCLDNNPHERGRAPNPGVLFRILMRELIVEWYVPNLTDRSDLPNRPEYC